MGEMVTLNQWAVSSGYAHQVAVAGTDIEWASNWLEYTRRHRAWVDGLIARQ